MVVFGLAVVCLCVCVCVCVCMCVCVCVMQWLEVYSVSCRVCVATDLREPDVCCQCVFLEQATNVTDALWEWNLALGSPALATAAATLAMLLSFLPRAGRDSNRSPLLPISRHFEVSSTRCQFTQLQEVACACVCACGEV